MGSFRAALRAAILATAVAAVVVPAAAPATAADAAPQHQADRQRRDIAPLPASPADSVVDSYGVGIHLNFLDTPYKNTTAVADALSALGVRHVRDDLYLDAPREYRAIAEVADRGIGFDLIMGRPGGSATPDDYVRTVADDLPRGAVESLEGANEWDLFGGDNWVQEVRDWQQQLYRAAKAEPATADLPVLSPALAFKWNYDDLGAVSAWSDLANAHMYPGGYQPSNQIGQITQAVRQAVPSEPLVTTEAGYHDAMNTSSGHRPVPEDVGGVYAPRLLLEHVARGEQRMYQYELLDSFDNPQLDDPEAHFGLLRHDFSPKPAYTAMQNLLALLADPGPAFAPGSLAVTADGLPGDARYLLTQKRDGRFVLLLWRNASIWDPEQQQATPVTAADVTVRLDAPYDLTVYRPSDGADPVTERVGRSVPVSLDGEVTAVTIDPTDPPAPTDVTAAPGDGSTTLAWTLPATSAKVTGFQVTRTTDGQSWTVGASDRSFDDSGLVNGQPYDYTVRTVGADGQSDTVATRVVPGTVPTAPEVRRIKPGRHRVVVVWRPSDGRGRAVTGYQLRVRGRTVTTGPNIQRRVIRGLPSGAKVRVTVQAHNELGWSAGTTTRRVRIR